MLQKAGIFLAFTIMGSLGVSATDTINFDNGVNIAAFADSAKLNGAEAVIDNTLNQYAENTPLAAYREQVLRIKKPSYDVLLPVLRKLSVYNKQFETIKDEERLRALAGKIAALTRTGWNTYRDIGIEEIYDRYIPVNQTDKQIALLEYNVKKYSMSKEQVANGLLLANMPVAKQFLSDFKAFTVKMSFAGKYNAAEIIKTFVPVIESYNAMINKVPATAALAKNSVFKTPVACGWGRTHTVEKLRDDLGIIWYAGGDAYEYMTAGTLQEKYSGLSNSDAEIYAEFVSNYYKK